MPSKGKKGDWSVYMSLLLESARRPEKTEELFEALVGTTFERPDGQFADTIRGVEGGQIQVDRAVVLKKPAEFITFRLSSKEKP